MPLRVGERPIEEIAFDGALDVRIPECGAGEKPDWVVISQTENSLRDCLGDNNKKGMLKPEGVSFYGASVYQRKQLLPQLPLQRRRGLIFDAQPDSGKLLMGTAVGNAFLAKFKPHRKRVRRQRGLQSYYTVEPARNCSPLAGSRVVSLIF